MENQSVIETFLTQMDEITDGVRRDLRVQFDFDLLSAHHMQNDNGIDRYVRGHGCSPAPHFLYYTADTLRSQLIV
jgi:hypothetical protein